jgi:selenocysteine lyase/cysteine desulfurase
VLFVSADHQEYVEDVEAREEAGTPNILGAIRCGAAFALRAAITAPRIQRLEAAAAKALITSLRTNPSIVLLGSDAPAYHEPDRMAIVSVVVKVPWATVAGCYGKLAIKQLHPHFVCKLLNDLYGIQARSGCGCAGPYGHQLLGLSEQEVRAQLQLTRQGESVVKAGWTRLSLSFSQPPVEVEYLAAALHQVTAHPKTKSSCSSVCIEHSAV